MTPKLSVVLPAYNRVQWLGTALDSVLAPGLDCELVYALVPRKTLAEQIEHQARSTVREQLARVTATMALEAQQTSEKAIGTLEDEMVKELLSKPRKALWK